MSLDGFGLSAQLAILKRSLRENFDLVIANRGDQKSQDLKALRTESTWREAPNSVRNGRECGLHFHLPLASSRVPQAAGRTATGRDPAPQRRGPRGVAPPPRCIARTPPRPRAGPAPRAVPAPPPRPPLLLPPPGCPAHPPKLRARPAPRRVVAVAGCQV